MRRFGIKAQILLLSLSFLSIPWIAWNFWQELQQAALNAQGRIQTIEAKAIATSLVATQENIADLLAANEESELQKHSLSAPSIQQAIRLDGIFDDWGEQNAELLNFKSSYIIWQADSDTPTNSAFSLALAQSTSHLYLALNVRDDQVQTRKNNHLRLDYNDQIQLTYYDEKGIIRRVIIPAQVEGDLASFYTDYAWRYGRDIADPDTGLVVPSHRTPLQGFWRKTNDGYAIEARIPTDSLRRDVPKLHVAVVDIHDNPVDGPKVIVASLPQTFENELNPLGLHARELQRVIDELKSTYARLWIYDRSGREWAYSGREARSESSPISFNTKCIQDALTGTKEPLQHLSGADGELSRLVACYPIVKNGDTLGVVVVDESASHILSQEEEKVRSIAQSLGIILVALLALLFGYAVLLARRITRLRDETKLTIDQHGRIENTALLESKHAPDELGDLSRSISSLLEKQQAYTKFLERVPQTLRHEIANPLNKLRTSVELLLDTQPELANNRYLQRIEAGTDQIANITAHLTEAANLENALQMESLEPLELCGFLKRYFANWDEKIELDLSDCKEPISIRGDASRLEQLFDKIMDNASSFVSKSGCIKVSTYSTSNNIYVRIENDGPLLPVDRAHELFSPMISTRSSGSEIHLGLGLHIAKLIVDHHSAAISAKNRKDSSGVIFEVGFPII